MARRRLDAEMVRRGLAADVGDASILIAEGRVTVGGAPADKPARLVDRGDAIVVAGPTRAYVGRGGYKLAAALDGFGVDVAGRRVLDAGASTGGFTDCLLQRGAAEVVAVDVGYGQLDARLRDNPRVEVRERTDVRSVELDPPADVVVADLSFISLRLVAGALTGDNAVDGAPVIVLIKPQFEATRAEADRVRGVISDSSIWRRVLAEVHAAFADHRATMMGLMVSPLRGAEGNVEFLACLRARSTDGGVGDAAFDAAVAAAVAEAGAE